MVALLFDVFYNATYTCVVEEDTCTSSSVIVSLEEKFVLYVALMVDAVRERLFFLEGSDTTYDTTS